MKRLFARAATAVVMTTAVAACGAGSTSGPSDHVRSSTKPLADLTTLADPLSYEGPSTAVVADRAVVPVVSSPAQSLPVSVTSHDRGGDRKVVVNHADRILALDISGSLAATVWALGLGDQLVGRDTSTTFPGTQKLPKVTSNGHSVNAESVLKVRPDIVITDGSVGPRDVIEQLRDAGVTVVFVKNEASFEGAQQAARDVAEVLGVPKAGKKLADTIAADLDRVRAQIDRIAPSASKKQLSIAFLYLRGSAGIYYLLGPGSGATDLVSELHGRDVADQLDWQEYQPLTDEAIVAANPDLFLVMTDGLESAGGVDKLLKAKPALALTNAGKHRRFVDMADGDVLSFGPRSAEVLEALARAVYAPDAS